MESTGQLQSLVGSRLRELRIERGLSQRELARRAEMTNANLSMIEQGRVSPSIQTLEKILRAVPISLADFFRYETPHEPSVSKKSEQTRIIRSGVETYVCLSPGIEGSPFLVQQCIEPGAVATEAPVHPKGSWLSAMVVKGTLSVVLGDACKTLESGDAIQFHSQRGFRLENQTNQDVTLFLVVSPIDRDIDNKV